MTEGTVESYLLALMPFTSSSFAWLSGSAQEAWHHPSAQTMLGFPHHSSTVRTPPQLRLTHGSGFCLPSSGHRGSSSSGCQASPGSSEDPGGGGPLRRGHGPHSVGVSLLSVTSSVGRGTKQRQKWERRAQQVLVISQHSLVASDRNPSVSD